MPHIGLTLDPDYVQQALQTGQDFRTGVLTGVYDDERYLVAQPCLMSDGTVGGLVVVSEPVRGMGIILSQIIQMFIFVALIVLLLTVMCISIFTQNQCRPLKAMANAAKEFGHGNLKARVETGGDNTVEIDELAVAFNNMASSLEQSEYQRQEFVANVSHELKTPMTTIGGYVDGILGRHHSAGKAAAVPHPGLRRGKTPEPPGAQHAGGIPAPGPGHSPG
ncbi:MAG: HAMP domain-containing protein [Oscillospiraceae bacterium]